MISVCPIGVASWFWRPLIRPQGLDRKSEMVDDVLLSSLTMVVQAPTLIEALMSRGAPRAPRGRRAWQSCRACDYGHSRLPRVASHAVLITRGAASPASADYVILDVWSGSDNGQTSNVYRCRYDSDPAKPFRYVNSQLTEARLSRPRP